MSKTRWMYKDQSFKLKFGKSNNNWASVALAETVNAEDLHDGVYLTENSSGKWEIASESDVPAYPMLEGKYQYDNQAIGEVTISQGSVIAYTKHFSGTPNKGDHMKVGANNGELVPVDTASGDTVDMAVARVNNVYGDYIEITKLF